MTALAADELIIEQIQIGPMENFTYIVGSQATREVVIVDPAWDIPALLSHIGEQDYSLVGALVTHYHPDHIGGAFGEHEIQGLAELIAASPVKCHAHKLEVDGVKKITGLSDSDLNGVESGDTLRVGDIEIEFLHTPGHTPGSQCFRIKNTLVSGDTLFINGCGRVDLPGSNPDDMFQSLQHLCSLPDETILLPGHNYSDSPTATLAETKATNTYLQVKDLASWRGMMGA
jgi:hydroxyacylglutathione hydrolase